MRSPSALLPLPFDRAYPRRSRVKAVLASRPARFVLIVTVALCFVVFLARHEVQYPFGPGRHHGHVAPIDAQETESAETKWAYRASRVKEAFVTAYGAYEEKAYPHDELLPKSGKHSDNLNGWGASLVDGMDTMMLMGLHDLSYKSLAHVEKLSFEQDQFVQFFETVIRYLGGLLSAYALTGRQVFLMRADALGQRLLPAFHSDATPLGMPMFAVNPHTGVARSGWAGPVGILSEIGSCQMEYRYLAHLTGKAEYIKTVDHITDFLEQHEEHGGLFPLTFDLPTGASPSLTYSVGAMADSTYEYLLKQWLQTNRTEQRYLDMYLRATDAILTNLLYLSPQRQLLYVTDVTRRSLIPNGDLQHLSCFLAGLLALGATTIPAAAFPASSSLARHRWAAAGLGHTCWLTYAESATGLGPERLRFSGANAHERWVDALDAWDGVGAPPGLGEAQPMGKDGYKEYLVSDARYLLRPETIESFYLLWRTTGDVKWRERGWAVFEAIERHTKMNGAYASVRDVNRVPPALQDDLPSFFFAETLKYAYLLFLDNDPIDLNRWVFNTEAHPLPVFQWSEKEKASFAIRA